MSRPHWLRFVLLWVHFTFFLFIIFAHIVSLWLIHLADVAGKFDALVREAIVVLINRIVLFFLVILVVFGDNSELVFLDFHRLFSINLIYFLINVLFIWRLFLWFIFIIFFSRVSEQISLFLLLNLRQLFCLFLNNRSFVNEAVLRRVQRLLTSCGRQSLYTA